MIFLCQKWEKMQFKSRKVIFQKSQKLLTERALSELRGGSLNSEHSIAIHSISMAGYVNAVPAFVCFELPAREASSFCDFWKLTSSDFIAFNLLYDWSKLSFF